MTLFELVKQNICVPDAAKHYGLQVNRNGMCSCPFHEDRHPSMKLNERYFYCFGCGATGDVTDLVARLFDLSNYEAAQKLAQDFGIDPDKPPAAIALPKPERPLLKAYRQEEVRCLRVLCDYLHLLESWKVQYSDEQLVLWRAAWADVANRYLERSGHEERIDHRSHAERGLLERPTVHEGVVARAMEKKGIISDRCELNRQIKADNALLQELRGQVKKLAQAVKSTLPALAEAMENLQKNLLLFCYQLGYLCKGKERLNASLNTLRPALTQYNQLAKDIRDKTKERRSLLTEKKALSAVHVFRHRELAAKIAALTEDLEELRSEKNLLLASLAYTEEDAADKFPKDIAAMEQSLKRLEEQEQKYSTELDAALNEYAGLREQAQGFNRVQLYEARQAIRPGKEQEAENRAQEVYGEKYNPLLMFDSKKAVSRMLHEDILTIWGIGYKFNDKL
ncbi:MobA/MobL family protein [Flavonifractor sp. An306]|uniref:MobA/MobL family protein n=1 Tax=Flavonifractor sp. An306 TaxID=1965629 RepID=UPI000B38AA00|nr:MobA/MobL family protein [Flavonifractor sp. An306]OUO42992.1 hypothetical protein B5F88_03300 [Flavonifractor sp. An306]